MKLPKIKDLTSLLDSGGNIADKMTTTDHEVAQELTKRLSIDLTSPFKLPHLIRPISFIWAMANETILTTATIFVVFFVKDADSNSVNTLMVALAANTTILTTIVGFFFQSRKNEKIAFNNSAATVKLEEMKLKHEIEQEVLKDKHEEKASRRANRRNK